MHKTPEKPDNTLSVLSEGKDRSDVGRKVVVRSVGGLVEGHDLRRLRYENKTSECNQKIVGTRRSLTGEPGVVVRGPYRIVFTAKTKQRTATGKIVKKFGKPILVNEQFTTDPYWLIRLDSNGLHLHFSEDEISFVT